MLCILPRVLDHLVAVEHPSLVPQGEVAWDVHAKGAGDAVGTAGTAVANALSHNLSNLLQGCTLAL